MERVLWPLCACGRSTKNVTGCVVAVVVVVIVSAQLRFKSHDVYVCYCICWLCRVISTVCARLSLGFGIVRA